MYPVHVDQDVQMVDKINTYTSFPLALGIQPDLKLYGLLADLSSDTSWGDRQIAAKQLGDMGNPIALPGLLDALPGDPFWMVRCAIIQALERIGDPGAIPTLREVVKIDDFQVVRSYAAKAIERLSKKAKIQSDVRACN